MAGSYIILVDTTHVALHVANDPTYGADAWGILTVVGSHTAWPAGVESTDATLSFFCEPGTQTVPYGWPGVANFPLALVADADYTIRVYHWGTDHEAGLYGPEAEFFIHTAKTDGTGGSGGPSVPTGKHPGDPRRGPIGGPIRGTPVAGVPKGAPPQRRAWVAGYDPYHQRFVLWAGERVFLFDPRTDSWDELTIGTYGTALCAATLTGPEAYLIAGHAKGLIQMTFDPGGLEAAWEYGCPSIVKTGRNIRVRRLLPQLTGDVKATLTIDGVNIDSESRTMTTSVYERYGPEAFGEQVDLDLSGAAGTLTGPSVIGTAIIGTAVLGGTPTGGAKLRSIVIDMNVRRA